MKIWGREREERRDEKQKVFVSMVVVEFEPEGGRDQREEGRRRAASRLSFG